MADTPQDKKTKQILKNRKIHNILEHERIHKEAREKMPQAAGGHTADISMDSELETLKKGWQEKTLDMRSRLRGRKERAKSLWRGR